MALESIFKKDTDEQIDELSRRLRNVEETLESLNERNILSSVDNELRKITKATYVGSGADGNVTFDGSTAVTGTSRSGSTYTLTSDRNFNNVTVNKDVIVLGRQYYLQIKGNLTNKGTIYANGGWW